MIKRSFASPLSVEALAFLSRETGIDFMSQDTSSWLCVTCTEDSELLALCCFEPKLSFDWHFSVAVADPRCLSRRLFQAMFTAVFSQAVRVTALIEPGNERAVRNARRMGFQYEGYVRMGVEGRRDALMFGMLKDDCRFLPGYQAGTIIRTDIGVADGQLTQTA